MRRHQHWLLGGLFIGILSALPVVQAANCCCLWVVAGGVLTAWLQQQERESPLQPGEAALSGLLAGLVGAAIQVAIMATIFSASGGMLESEVAARLQENPEIPPDLRERLTAILTGGSLVVVIAAFTVPAYAVVALLGGLLGQAIFKKKVPPAADV